MKEFYFCCIRMKKLLLILGFWTVAAFGQENSNRFKDVGVNDGELPPMVLANRYMVQGQYKSAENIYRDELNRNDVPAVRQQLCNALIMQKQYYEADTMLRGLVLLDSNAEGNYWFLAISADRQEKSDVALMLYKKYIRKAQQRIQNTHSVETENAKAWLKMGSIFRRKMHGKGINDAEWVEMVYDYEVYLRMNPTDQFAFNLQEFVDQVRLRRPDPMGGVLVWDEK
jgi:tetratricopeptide (TPR) repeat protein